MSDTKPPCIAYQISQSTGAAICRLHSNLPPECLCTDYSPDFGTYGYRLQRWTDHLMIDRPGDMQSKKTP